MHQIQPIDVDHSETWPVALTQRVEASAELLHGTTDYTSDLEVPSESEDEFRSLLVGRPLIAYHATRLLPHESLSIRQTGLRLADERLVSYRLDAALQAGEMDEELHQHLSRTHVFHEPGGADDRRGQVCFVLSRGLFDYNPGGFGYLLTEWGGELITMSGGGSSVRPRLREIGAPSIVVVALDLSHRWRVHASYPSLEKLFIGKRLGLEDAGSDVHYRAAVTGESILDIWQPGDPEYDRHSGLPR